MMNSVASFRVCFSFTFKTPVNRLDFCSFGKEAIVMARMHQLFALAAVSFALTGCVTSADKYQAVKMENEALRSQLGDAQSQASRAEAERNAYKGQLASVMDGTNSKDALIQNQAQQIATLSSQVAELNAKYEHAIANVGTGPALPAVVTHALDSFAHDNPDLVDFDSARGIVKFKTDFTFATGSADLTEKAKSAISRFASILNSEAARSYELMVAGHTDNAPVVNTATKAKHPDNWYLSAHRAIAVGDELIKHGVSAQRVADVGYADQRPIASNGTAEGKAQNRRVEVLILPSTVRAPIAGTHTAPKAKTASTPRKPVGSNKDEVATPNTGPIYNK
jgi:chemotaxis protein MotB